MIDTVYQTLLTIINKENQGYVSPTEFNLLANNVQQEIFRGYFEDNNRDKNKENRGLTNLGYANLDLNERQRIQQFASVATLPVVSGVCTLPSNLYFIEQDGITTSVGQTYENKVVDEVERNSIGYLNQTAAAPTQLYPVYERYGSTIKVYPTTVTSVDVRYLRTPSFPNWTYQMVANQPMYNSADVSHQDFELHESEFANIVLKLLSYFSINLRENEVVQIAETLKDKMNLKDNN